MAWTKVPEEHVAILRGALEAIPEAESRPMFGCPVWWINGHMLAGAHQDTVFLHLSDADEEEFLRIPGAGAFSPMPGRVMRGYVAAPPSIYRSQPDFCAWLQRARDYLASLPPKERKKR